MRTVAKKTKRSSSKVNKVKRKTAPSARARSKTGGGTAKGPRKQPARKPARGTRPNTVQSLFPQLAGGTKRFGLGVLLAVAEQQGASADVRFTRAESFFAKPARRPKATLLAKADPGEVAKLLGGIAHQDRIRIAGAILAGANTHKLLEEAVGLKAGPLYHHIRSLERAGLLETVSRNVYGLTELGRVALLVATALGNAVAKGRSGWRKARA